MMKTQKAIHAFLDAKHDLSPRTLEQYHKALQRLEQACLKMPTDPRSIRSALNSVVKTRNLGLKTTPPG